MRSGLLQYPPRYRHVGSSRDSKELKRINFEPDRDGPHTAGGASAEPPRPIPRQDVSSEEEIRAALFGGVPDGRWKEGLLFEGIRPSPWMKSASN
jgi:hypothetical protein